MKNQEHSVTRISRSWKITKFSIYTNHARVSVPVIWYKLKVFLILKEAPNIHTAFLLNILWCVWRRGAFHVFYEIEICMFFLELYYFDNLWCNIYSNIVKIWQNQQKTFQKRNPIFVIFAKPMFGLDFMVNENLIFISILTHTSKHINFIVVCVSGQLKVAILYMENASDWQEI